MSADGVPTVSLAGVPIGLELTFPYGPASAYFSDLSEVHGTDAAATTRIRKRTELMPAPAGQEVWSHGPLRVLEAASGWSLTGAETRARVSADGSELAFVEPRDEHSSGWDRASASAALSLLMRASSRYYLHAAVVQWRSQSVLIVGPSGVGKTTLAVLMALEGGELLGDDSAFVGPEQVWPVAHAVRIDPASLMFHRELAYSIDAEAGEKAIFRELRPQGRPVSADVLFFPTRVTSGGLAAQPMAPATALLGLLAASPFATERRMAGTAQQLAFLAALANRCVSFRISTGPKLLESPSGELAKLARALN